MGLASLYLYTSRDYSPPPDDPDAQLEYIRKQSIQKWGDPVLAITNSAALEGFLSQHSIQTNPGVPTTITSTQKNKLRHRLATFLTAYSQTNFSAILDFYDAAPFSFDLSAFENSQDFSKVLHRDQLQWPSSPREKARTYWLFRVRVKWREQFWNDHVSSLQNPEKTIPNEIPELIAYEESLTPEYHSWMASHGPSTHLAVFTHLNTEATSITITAGPSDSSSLRETLGSISGAGHAVPPRVIRYKRTCEDIAKSTGTCLEALVGMVIRTNISPAMLPFAARFYWDPNHETWLLNGFRTVNYAAVQFIL